MGTFNHLQRKPSSTSSTPAAPTSHYLSLSRPFAPVPFPTSEQVAPPQQIQPVPSTRLSYSLADIPIFPPERENRTGMPDNLKAGIERFSGLSMADVRVHYNSSKPAQIQALAYTQGRNIHVGPGQEKHLAHEAWHVVQQSQGRVRPTLQAREVAINDDEALEREAESMGTKVVQDKHISTDSRQNTGSALSNPHRMVSSPGSAFPIQRYILINGKRYDNHNSDEIWSDGHYPKVAALKEVNKKLFFQYLGDGEPHTIEEIGTLTRAEVLERLKPAAEPTSPTAMTSEKQLAESRSKLSPAITAATKQETQAEEHFKINRRETEWGSVVEVAPGIGVEVMKTDKDQNYEKFISEQLEEIRKTEVGRTILNQFNPQGKEPNKPKFRQLGDGPYKGLTVLIGQPQYKPTAKPESKERTIHTDPNFVGRQPKGQKIFPKGGEEYKGIARINFYTRQAPGEEVQVGDTPAHVTSEGLVRHKDFPDITQTFDVVLFHEFMHAYLSQLGVSERITKSISMRVKKDGKVVTTLELLHQEGKVQPKYPNEDDALEEQLVSGLVGGKGMPFSENVYRCQKRYPPRTSYLAVGINKDDALKLEDFTNKTGGIHDIHKSIYDAVIAAGLTDELAGYIAYGTPVNQV